MTLHEVEECARALSSEERRRIFNHCGTHDPKSLPTTETGEHYCGQCCSLWTAAGDPINLPLLSSPPTDHQVSPAGVWFASKERAKTYANLYDKDLAESDGGWLAKNRASKTPPLPTQEGDVVVLHRHQAFVVWVATWPGAQGPDPNVQPITVSNDDEAQAAAHRWAERTRGRIFKVQHGGSWSVRSSR